MNKIPKPSGLPGGKKITKQLVLESVAEIVAEMPRRMNPRDPRSGSCAYQQGNRHCIIGEMLHRLGADVSDKSVFDNTTPVESIYSIRHWFTDSGHDEAANIQELFDEDTYGSYDSKRHTWAKSWERYLDKENS